MRHQEISQEKILTVAREILEKEPDNLLNIREVAQGCGVSVGSIYNYFPQKSDLILALIEHYWENIFKPLQKYIPQGKGYVETVLMLYQLLVGSKEMQFLLHHQSMVAQSQKSQGKEKMRSYLQRIQQLLLQALEQDKTIPAHVWNQVFTQEKMVDFTLSHVVSQLQRGGGVEFLKEILIRSLK